jgi:hypothetical protein
MKANAFPLAMCLGIVAIIYEQSNNVITTFTALP